MKASEVLKRYAAGERNFCNLNLRGQSFKGQNLSGADFSNADIRSTDFTGANLQKVNFTGVKAGLERRWNIFILVISFMSVISEALLFFNLGAGISQLKTSAWPTLILMIIFAAIILRGGIKKLIFLAIGATVVSGVGVVTGGLLLLIKIQFMPGLIAFAYGLLFAISIVSIFTTSFIAAIGKSMAYIVMGMKSIISFVIAGISIIGVAFFLPSFGSELKAIVLGIAGIGVGIIISSYIAWEAVKGNKKYITIRELAVFFAAFGGTKFYEANLTDADFKRATLQSTNFRKAILTRTNFYKTNKLDFVSPGNTYLKSSEVRQLLTTRQGQHKNFDRLDLRDINLQEANLENASFIDADFYQASLQDANLSRTKLVRTNFERADLRDANLTGSCIQDWVITESTKLDGIACDYVYLNWVDGDKRDQMPPRGKFKEGGFVTFVRYILETV